MSVFEIPVPRCASRLVTTPSPASLRPSCTSSGWTSESPVASSFFSAGSLTGVAPSSAGSKASVVIGAAAPEPPPAADTGPPPTGAELKPPGPPDRSSSGDSAR